MSALRALFLFDIDGTLLVTEGAAREAFSAAAFEIFGIEDDLKQVEFAGRTEPLIVADLLARRGLSLREDQEGPFWDALVGHMERLFVPPRGRLLPGVPELLDTLEGHPEFCLGLLTGNLSRVARIKLARFGLEDRFGFGAFGEEAADRNELARLAVRRASDRLGLPAARTIVVGDTPYDIECARAAGAHAVAVATGGVDREVLAAHGPDLVLDGFSDPEPLVAYAKALVRR